MALIMFSVTKKALNLKLNFMNYIVKPSISTLFMGIVSFFSYKLIYNLFSSNTIALFISIFFAVIVFLVCILVFKVFKKEEIESLPMGATFSKVLVKLKLY